MSTTEITAIETDQPMEKTTARRAKFKLEMMLLMMASGRGEEASQLMDQALTLLDELIDDGH